MGKIKSIGVIGLGYVGLPLSLLAEEKGFEVIGIDLDQEKLKKLKTKKPIIDDKIANEQLKKTSVTFTDKVSKLKDVDAIIICVPTPVDKQKNPDISLVKKASISAAKHLKTGGLLVVESTINPGVCDEIVIPAININTDHEVGKTMFVAHCPERINPGDPKWHVGNINRVLGADTKTGLELAAEMYERLIDGEIKQMGSLKEAEAVKVVENSFRDINIAFVNELAMSFTKLGINVVNVIDGAATKPFAFMPHYPGIGVGGHCIPVDPYYLIQYARDKGFEHHFLSLARSINESMPEYAVDLLKKQLGSLKHIKVAVLGVSYKPNVGDDRESPAYNVIDKLKHEGASVSVFDPYIPEKSSADSLEEVIDGADAIVLVTAHQEFQKIKPISLKGVRVFLDGRNMLKNQVSDFKRAKIEYIGIGAI